jgi:GTP-binding protein
MIVFERTSFIKSCPLYSQLPQDNVPEVAVAGRSNAGKSTLINTLCHQSKLAKTSGKPGKTREMNLFNLYENGHPDNKGGLKAAARLVDLPGYGYAKANFKLQQQWQDELTQYLTRRENLTLLIVIMDSRHPLRDLDQLTINMAAKRNLRQILVFNKADKLNQSEKSKTVKIMREAQSAWPNVSALSYSSTKPIGRQELEALINRELNSTEKTGNL